MSQQTQLERITAAMKSGYGIQYDALINLIAKSNTGSSRARMLGKIYDSLPAKYRKMIYFVDRGHFTSPETP